jgi:hypothetical protein
MDWTFESDARHGYILIVTRGDFNLADRDLSARWSSGASGAATGSLAFAPR